MYGVVSSRQQRTPLPLCELAAGGKSQSHNARAAFLIPLLRIDGSALLLDLQEASACQPCRYPPCAIHLLPPRITWKQGPWHFRGSACLVMATHFHELQHVLLYALLHTSIVHVVRLKERRRALGRSRFRARAFRHVTCRQQAWRTGAVWEAKMMAPSTLRGGSRYRTSCKFQMTGALYSSEIITQNTMQGEQSGVTAQRREERAAPTFLHCMKQSIIIGWGAISSRLLRHTIIWRWRPVFSACWLSPLCCALAVPSRRRLGARRFFSIVDCALIPAALFSCSRPTVRSLLHNQHRRQWQVMSP